MKEKKGLTLEGQGGQAIDSLNSPKDGLTLVGGLAEGRHGRRPRGQRLPPMRTLQCPPGEDDDE